MTLAQARARARAPHRRQQGLAWAQAQRRQHPWALERAPLARAPRPRQHPWLSELVGAPPSRHCPPEPAAALPEPGAARQPAACCARRASQRRRMPRQRRGRAVASALLERGVASAALLQLDAGAVVARRGWPRASPGASGTRDVSASCTLLDGAQAVTVGSHHVKTRARLTTGTRGGHSHHSRGWGGPRRTRFERCALPRRWAGE